MTIGNLTASLGLNAGAAIKEMTSFQKMMITAVTNIDNTLARMESSMGRVGASAATMSQKTVRGFRNITIAANAAANAAANVTTGAMGNTVIQSAKKKYMAPTITGSSAAMATPIITPQVDSKPAIAAIDNIATSIQKTAQKFRTFGYLSSIVVTAPIIMAGKASIKTASDFEYSMQKIVGLAGVAQSAVDGLSKSILKLAPEVAQTPQALAEAAYFILSGGIKDTAKALEILKISAQGATAGLGETADVAKLMVFTMNAYKKSNLSAANIADMLTVAVREGAIEADGFASAVQSVIPIASAMNVSLGQVLGTMSAMSLQGANAANSAVYLKGILNSIMKIKPTNQAGKALEKLGSSGAKLKEVLGSGPNGLMNVLLQIQAWSKQEGQNDLLTKIFGNIRSMTGDLSLVGDNLQANEALINKVINAFGDFSKAGVATANTIKKRMNSIGASMKSSIIGLGSVLAEYLLPVFSWIAKGLANMIEGFTRLSKTTQKIIIFTVALVAALGPLSLLSSLILYISAGLVPFINLLGSVIYKFGQLIAVIQENPYLLLAAAIALVGFAIYKMVQQSNPLDKMYKELNMSISKEIFSLDSLFNKLQNANLSTKERSDTIKMVNSRYGEYLSKLLTEKSTLNDITKAQEEATKALVKNMSVKQYTKEIETQQGNIASSIEKYFGNIMNKWSETFGADRLGEFVTGLNKAINDAISVGMEKDVNGVSKSLNILDKFYNDFVVKMGAGANKNLRFTDFSRAFYELIPSMRTSSKTIDELNAKVKAFGNTGKVSIGDVKNTFGNLSPILLNLGKVMLGMGGNIFTMLGKSMGLFAQSLVVANTGLDDFKDNASSLKSVTTVITEMRDKLVSLEIMAKVSEMLGKSFDLAKEKANLIISVISQLTESPYKLKIDDKDIQGLIKEVLALGVDFSEVNKEVEKAKKVMQEYSASIASIQIRKKIEPSFNINIDTLEASKKAYEDYVKVISEQVSPASLGDFIPIENLVPKETLDNLKKLYEEYQKWQNIVDNADDEKTLRFLNAQAEAFRGIDNQIEVFNFELQRTERLMRKEGETNGMSDSFIKLGEKANYIREKLLELNNIKKMDFLSAMNNAFKDSAHYSDLLSGKIQVLQSELEYLSAMKPEGWEQTFKTTAKEINKLNTQLQVTDVLTNSFTDFLVNVTDNFNNFGSFIRSWVTSLLKEFQRLAAAMIAQKIIGALMQGTTKEDKNTPGKSLATNIALAGAEVAKTAAIGASTAAMTASIPVMAAATTAAGQLAIAESIAAGAWVPFPGNLAAIATGSATVIAALAAGLAAVTGLNAIPGLVEGGVIPKGYPNDSYPAMLTSGEVVTPPGKLNQASFNKQPNMAELLKDVVFHIGNNELIGTFEKHKRKVKSYS